MTIWNHKLASVVLPNEIFAFWAHPALLQGFDCFLQRSAACSDFFSFKDGMLITYEKCYYILLLLLSRVHEVKLCLPI